MTGEDEIVDADDPQAMVDRRAAARHLVQRPLTSKEHDPDIFRLVRRHEGELDRWFTQRLGYRLHVDADTARLTKNAFVPAHRPLRTSTGRAFSVPECVVLALVLASTAAGPAVISLRDLVDQVRSAAAEADIARSDRPADRRALVTVLRWMIDLGLAAELHSHVDAYASDEDADAVLKVRPDRIALLPLPALLGASSAEELIDGAEHRQSARQWMRARLLEDPVLYRQDLTDAEWAELRRRLGEEDRILHEMFGLVLESRAEGVAAIDPTGSLAETRFPTGGTVGHAALLLLEALRDEAVKDEPIPLDRARTALVDLTRSHATTWSKDRVADPDLLLREVMGLLVSARLAELLPPGPPDRSGHSDGTDGTDSAWFRLLPGAGRFLAVDATRPSTDQTALW